MDYICAGRGQLDPFSSESSSAWKPQFRKSHRAGCMRGRLSTENCGNLERRNNDAAAEARGACNWLASVSEPADTRFVGCLKPCPQQSKIIGLSALNRRCETARLIPGRILRLRSDRPAAISFPANYHPSANCAYNESHFRTPNHSLCLSSFPAFPGLCFSLRFSLFSLLLARSLLGS